MSPRPVAWLLAVLLTSCAGGRPSIPALVKALKSPDPRARAEAAQMLSERGEEAMPAVPALIQAMRDRDASVYRAVGNALAHLGEEARPGLASLAADPAAWLRCRAVETLGRLGPSPDGVSTLMRALTDHDQCVQGKAMEALARAGDSAVPPLVGSLKSPNPAIRRSAAEALGRMSAEAQERAVFPLIQDLRGPDEYARGAAELLLGELGPPSAPFLAELLDDPDADIRRRAVVLLGRVGSADENVVAGLAARLVDKDRIVRLKASLAMGEIGERDGRMLPALLARLSTAQDPSLRRGLTAAVGDMGPAARSAVGKLIGMLSDEDRQVREEASESLMKIGTIEAMNAAEGHNRKNLK